MSADLKSDLAPFYGPTGVPVGGLGREAFAEVRAFYRARLEEMDRADKGCRGCKYYAQLAYCAKWEDYIPEDHIAGGCDAWIYDSIPF